MISTDVPWLSVSGYGAHIKSTQKQLILQRKNVIEEYPINSIRHLLLIGGHTITTAVILSLLKNGAFISFFEPGGNPVGITRPYGDTSNDEIQKIQRAVPKHRFATLLAQGAIKSRLIAIAKSEESLGKNLLYDGESQFLHKALDELEYLIKLDEIRRLHRLTADMYYEIMSRNIPPDLGFRRRTLRPQFDVVNAMLSFGYAVLFGNCCVSIIGARLDPDIGLLHEGNGGLVYDLIESLKAEMVDATVFHIAREQLQEEDFEQTKDRCILSEELMQKMIKTLRTTINNEKIDEQVFFLSNALQNPGSFKVLY